MEGFCPDGGDGLWCRGGIAKNLMHPSPPHQIILLDQEGVYQVFSKEPNIFLAYSISPDHPKNYGPPVYGGGLMEGFCPDGSGGRGVGVDCKKN